MPSRSYRTDRRLWIAFASVVFVALGFADCLTPGKGGTPTGLWPMIGFLIEKNDTHLTTTVAPVLAVQAVVLLFPAALIGWSLQAVVVTARGRSGERNGREPTPTSSDPP
jgi:hypothetical protein